ncbi:MAG: hypothetical protein AAFU85_02595 [Planctomycetota bacterium]
MSFNSSLIAIVLLSSISFQRPAWASDHADPMDIKRLKPLEPVITDLFVFPVDSNGILVHPYRRDKDWGNTETGQQNSESEPPSRLALREADADRALPVEQRDQINGLIVVLCIRRELSEPNSLRLSRYHYQVHIDTRTKPSYRYPFSEPDDGVDPQEAGLSVEEATLRYGGLIGRPENIEDDVLIDVRLSDKAKVDSLSVVRGLTHANDEDMISGGFDAEKICVWSGVRDDPFIFPAFSQTNVVAMVLHLPIKCFSEGQRDWLIWATSHRGRKQIDHVGRSLRTQNPRFESLNRLHPRDHVEAIVREHEHPGFVRDFALRLNVQNLFAFREWDFVPDVMVYSNRFRAGFPNGRLLHDDVAAILATHGDTLLYELSFHNGQWPRRTTNDKSFWQTSMDKPELAKFPYLAEPWDDPVIRPPHKLSLKNLLIVFGLLGVVLSILILAFLQVIAIAKRFFGLTPRERYL